MPYPRTVTIVHRAPAVEPDRYGAKPLTETSREPSAAFRQQSTASEDHADRDTRVTTWDYQLPPTVTITALDLIEDDGTTFEIVGDPELVEHPWAGADDHWELRATVVTG